MSISSTIKLPTDVAMALKEIIISAMPKKTNVIVPIEIMMWIKLKNIAKKIHDKLFLASKEISLSLSLSEELALYEFLINDKEGTIVSLDSVLLHFLKEVDTKIKTSIFLTKK